MTIPPESAERSIHDIGDGVSMDIEEFEQGVAALINGGEVLDAIAVDGGEGKGKISGPGVQNSPDQIDDRLAA